MTMNTVALRMEPTGEPSCGIAAKKGRRRGSACSVASSTAPPHSPPSERPCRTRSTMMPIAPSHPAVA